MNYCVYNKELDQFLRLTYSYDEEGAPKCEGEWGDEFVYAFADPNEGWTAENVKTVWSVNTEDKHRDYSLFIWRRIEEMNTSKNGMNDVRFIPVTGNIPDFERECVLLK